jgi:hypothetical protein
MKVFKEPCKNCLLSKDRIVSPARMKAIINGCKKEQSYFICHKAATCDDDEDANKYGETCCATYYKQLGHFSQLIRIMERLNGIEFQEQPDCEKLPTYEEMHSKTKKQTP